MPVASDIKIRANGQWISLRNQKLRADGAWKNFGKIRANGQWYELSSDLIVYPTLKFSANVDIKAPGNGSGEYYRQILPLTTGNHKIGRKPDTDNAKIMDWTGTTLSTDVYRTHHDNSTQHPFIRYDQKYLAGSLFSDADAAGLTDYRHIMYCLLFYFDLSAFSRSGFTKVYLEYTKTAQTGIDTNFLLYFLVKNMVTPGSVDSFFSSYLNYGSVADNQTSTGAKSFLLDATTIANLKTQNTIMLDLYSSVKGAAAYPYLETIFEQWSEIDINSLRLRFSNV